jgi:hypothetical protein
MAKKQTFGDKMAKHGKDQKTYVKIVKSKKSDQSGGVRFNEEVVGIPSGENVENFVKKFLSDK